MTWRPGYRGAVQTPGGLFGGVFSRGQVDTSGPAWLQAMLDTEAGLARALEAAGLAAPGALQPIFMTWWLGNAAGYYREWMRRERLLHTPA